MAKTEKRRIGDIGEKLTARFLEKFYGYEIVETNYSRKWGEIDVIAKKNKILHFVEVKSLKIATRQSSWQARNDDYLPEDSIRAWKKQRMARAIQTYFLDRKISDETDFQIDVAAVFLDFERKKARIRLLENVIL